MMVGLATLRLLDFLHRLIVVMNLMVNFAIVGGNLTIHYHYLRKHRVTASNRSLSTVHFVPRVILKRHQYSSKHLFSLQNLPLMV